MVVWEYQQHFLYVVIVEFASLHLSMTSILDMWFVKTRSAAKTPASFEGQPSRFYHIEKVGESDKEIGQEIKAPRISIKIEPASANPQNPHETTPMSETNVQCVSQGPQRVRWFFCVVKTVHPASCIEVACEYLKFS
jgi:hypothetical protein